MSVIVLRTRVNTGGKIYLPGEQVTGLSKKEEQELVDLGVCRFPDVVTDEPHKDQENAGVGNEIPEGVTKLGGGYYLLPNGDKVRGLPAVLEAMADLQSGAEKSEDAEDGPKTGILDDGQ